MTISDKQNTGSPRHAIIQDFRRCHFAFCPCKTSWRMGRTRPDRDSNLSNGPDERLLDRVVATLLNDENLPDRDNPLVTTDRPPPRPYAHTQDGLFSPNSKGLLQARGAAGFSSKLAFRGDAGFVRKPSVLQTEAFSSVVTIRAGRLHHSKVSRQNIIRSCFGIFCDRLVVTW